MQILPGFEENFSKTRYWTLSLTYSPVLIFSYFLLDDTEAGVEEKLTFPLSSILMLLGPTNLLMSPKFITLIST